MHAKAWRLSELGIVEIPTGGWNAGVEWNRGSGRGWNQRGSQRTGHRKNSDFIRSVLIWFKAGISKCDPWTCRISIIWEFRHANSFGWVIINKTSILVSHLKKYMNWCCEYNKNKAVWQKQSRVFVCVYVLFRHKWLINLNYISKKKILSMPILEPLPDNLIRNCGDGAQQSEFQQVWQVILIPVSTWEPLG